jgi:cell fate (sporulation/competence/biofilm development) regulator YlbF (YheA/YmcA/DUF963 family)
MVIEETSLIGKTKELCAHIAADPEFLSLQASIERFMNDDAARLQYQSVHELGEELHNKQRAGVELGASEIREFEMAREALLDNEVASDFLAAQRQLESMQKEIGKYISTTIELGRVPTEDDLAERSGGGCCGGGGGGGCGC